MTTSLQYDQLPKLFSVLAGKGPNGANLAHRLCVDVRPHVVHAMSGMANLFPDFTPHSLDHFDSVVSTLGELIPQRLLDDLNAYEIYFLLAAAYLHDVGMVEAFPGKPKGEDFDRFCRDFNAAEPGASERRIVAEYVRRTHHHRSEQYISSKGVELGLGTFRTEWPIIGRIAAGHRETDLSDTRQFGAINYTANGNHRVRRDLLAAYLRLADELDITAARTPHLALESVGPDTPQALEHWNNHLSVIGIGASNQLITVTARCEDYDIHLRLLELERKIQGTLDEIVDSLPTIYSEATSEPLSSPIPYTNVRFDIEAVGYKALQIRFELDPKRIIGILSSLELYKSPNAVVRELIQNAVDACRLRARLSPPSEQYVPSIRLEVASQDGTDYLIVEDNGFGMDEHVVESYLSKAGKSFYRSTDFDALHSGLHPISHHGIGLLSAFMVGTRISIETKRRHSEALLIDIRDLDRYFKIMAVTRSEEGTKVTVCLKADHGVQLEMAARHYVRCLDIAVRGVDHGCPFEIPTNPEMIFDWRERWRDAHSDGSPLSQLGQKDDSRYVARELRIDKADWRARLVAVLPRRSSGLVGGSLNDVNSLVFSNQGIYLTEDVDHRSSQVFGLNVLGNVDLSRHRPDISLDRSAFAGHGCRDEITAEIRRQLISVIDGVSRELSTDRGPVVQRRTYMFGLMFAHLGGETALQAGRRNVDVPFSFDHDVLECAIRVYGECYLTAWKHGADARFQPLCSLLEDRSVRRIAVTFADPMYYLFRVEAVPPELAALGTRIAVIDDPREYGLIRTFVSRSRADVEVIFLSGWSQAEMYGYRRVRGILDQMLPPGFAVVDSPLLDSEVAGTSCDYLFATVLAAESGTESEPPPTEPVVLLNQFGHIVRVLTRFHEGSHLGDEFLRDVVRARVSNDVAQETEGLLDALDMPYGDDPIAEEFELETIARMSDDEPWDEEDIAHLSGTYEEYVHELGFNLEDLAKGLELDPHGDVWPNVLVGEVGPFNPSASWDSLLDGKQFKWWSSVL